jgi:aspartate 1-decarboxylase
MLATVENPLSPLGLRKRTECEEAGAAPQATGANMAAGPKGQQQKGTAKWFYIQPAELYTADAFGSLQRVGHGFMLVHVLKSKIHRAQVTAGNVEYEGSLGIARDLMDKVGLLPYERILCGNMANGERFETYAIPAEPGSGQIILNGATARLGRPGDRLTIMSFTEVPASEAKSWKPQVIVLGEKNAVISERGI